jgi:hypothetical protein
MSAAGRSAFPRVLGAPAGPGIEVLLVKPAQKSISARGTNPVHRHIVTGNFGIVGHQGEGLDLGLGNEQPIERVAVKVGQVARSGRM